VPLVENGRTDPEDLVVSTVVGEYLAEIRAAGADTVVMGCTHYPLLERAIDAGMDGGAVLISPGREAAERIARALERDGAGNAPDHAGTSAYYVSDAAEGFAAAAERFLCEPVSGVVEKVDVEGKTESCEVYRSWRPDWKTPCR
jgi:glutamate racemase